MDRVNGFYMAEQKKSRNVLFLVFSIVSLILFHQSLKTLFIRSFHDEIYDYITVIPLVSIYFFYLKRREIFSRREYSLKAGVSIIVLGVFGYFIGRNRESTLNQNDFLSIVSFSIVVVWIGGFLLFYGLQALKKALFPLLFLFFIVPFPPFLLEKVISLLQEGSAGAAFFLFRLSGVPVLREGFVFYLPRLSIEVAEQCSGIHSAIALFITSIMAGKFFLVTGWKRCLLAFVVFPIAILKNGLRIVTLSLLGSYVDERILSGSLHKQGGIPFFLLAVSFLFVVLWLLRRSEEKGDLRLEW